MNGKIRSALKTVLMASVAMPALCEVALANPPGFSPISAPPPSGTPSSTIIEIPQGSASGTINLENGDTLYYTTVNPCSLPTDCLSSTSSDIPQMPNEIANKVTVGDDFTNTHAINSPIANQTEFLFLDTTPTVLEDAPQ